MFAKTISKAQQLEVEIRERKVTKVYVCRVKGEFPRCATKYMYVRERKRVKERRREGGRGGGRCVLLCIHQ